eukprot:gnl/TRDRNA2_/TRDRNA2_150702_c2_seq1.p1 gnl/TRDRNA2_/TRDRNA2_150702_c2~~gnl/TRDRNA2_/TRDRNA2_150702_c2_seq1.p1  ORF type:complete len:738 (+),score=152.47 gnl/TRDRNA2_/TRDRNA2_150702_c2_seq1:49-2262(+)
MPPASPEDGEPPETASPAAATASTRLSGIAGTSRPSSVAAGTGPSADAERAPATVGAPSATSAFAPPPRLSALSAGAAAPAVSPPAAVSPPPSTAASARSSVSGAARASQSAAAGSPATAAPARPSAAATPVVSSSGVAASSAPAAASARPSTVGAGMGEQPAAAGTPSMTTAARPSAAASLLVTSSAAAAPPASASRLSTAAGGAAAPAASASGRPSAATPAAASQQDSRVATGVHPQTNELRTAAAEKVGVTERSKPKAKPTIAPAGPLPTGRAAGFFAEDALTALSKRAEWSAHLSEDAVLETSEQSDSGGGLSDVDTADEDGTKDGSRKGRAKASVADAGTASQSFVDNEALDTAKAKMHFAQASSEAAKPQELEPPSRRLRRLRAEVDALCLFAKGNNRVEAGQSQMPSELAASSRLRSDATEVDVLVHRAVASANEDAKAEAAMPKQMWLSPSDSTSVPTIRQLVQLCRSTAETGGEQRTAHAGRTGHGSRASPRVERSQESRATDNGRGLSYVLSSDVGAGHGIFAAAAADAFSSLELRAQRLSEAVKVHSGDAGESLAADIAVLHRRLQRLQQLSSDDSCERLRASVQMLSADLEVAVAEQARLSALEAEQVTDGPCLGPGGVQTLVEQTPAQQIGSLYEQVACLSGTGARVAELEGQLSAREAALATASDFSQDLSAMEARMNYAIAELQTVLAASKAMHASAVSSREALQRSAAGLEAKLQARATRS